MKKFFLIIACLTFALFQYTYAQPIQIDYSTFNTLSMNGWNTVNGTSTNQWYVGVATGYNNSASIYISNDGGISNSYSTTDPSIVHIYKDIDFSLANNLTFLTFNWSCWGERNHDFFNIHLVPTSVMPVAGQEITEGRIGNARYSGFDSHYRGAVLKIEPSVLVDNTMRLVISVT